MTVQHDGYYYSLSESDIIKVFILIIFTMSRLLSSEEEEEGLVLLSKEWQRWKRRGDRRGGRGEAGTLDVTLWNYIIISV